MRVAASPQLPGILRDNPRLDQWVRIAEPGKVTVATGRVEIGQGVLTAMRQIAAEELDVAPDRILLQTGDTALTPNEGYTAGSQSIQFGGVALRQACAEVRALFLDAAAAKLGHVRDALSVENGTIRHAAKGPIDIMRDGNFVAILGPDETIVEAAAAVAPHHVAWDNVDALNP